MKKTLLLLICTAIAFLAVAQIDTTTTVPKYWKNSVTLGFNISQATLINPAVGTGTSRAGGTIMLGAEANYKKGRLFFLNNMDWTFGLLRLGSGRFEASSNRKIPFQKTIDALKISSRAGYAFSYNAKFFLVSGLDFSTQITPSYKDPERKVRGVFLKDIRNSNQNPIQSNFLAPASLLVYAGIGYRPAPKFFIAYSPTAYKGILVLDDDVASLVGEVDANGLPTATVHGNKVEIVNGRPVFRNSFKQYGSYLVSRYTDKYAKGKVGVDIRLELFSNYLNKPEKVDVWWRNQVSFNIIKGLKLSYIATIFYDYDVLVEITDKDSVGGFSGELGRKVGLTGQLAIQYQIAF